MNFVNKPTNLNALFIRISIVHNPKNKEIYSSYKSHIYGNVQQSKLLID